MEKLSALLAFRAGNSPVSGESFSQRPVTRSFDAFLDLRLNKRLGKRDAGDLRRRHHVHYDVTVMFSINYELSNKSLQISHRISTSKLMERITYLPEMICYLSD